MAPVDRVFVGDCLTVLPTMDADSVDLVYVDPPYGTGQDWGAFDDRWHDDTPALDISGLPSGVRCAIRAAGECHSRGMAVYLRYLAVRLIAVRRVLRPSGSLYLQCDSTSNSYIRIVLDAIFGESWFRNQIVWCYAPNWQAARRTFPRKYDTLLYYADRDVGSWNRLYTPFGEATMAHYKQVDENGRVYKRGRDGNRAYLDERRGRPVVDWWTDIHAKHTAVADRQWTGYPTQKPVALLERIIRASSNPGDIVLDPMCGSGTTLVAAHQLGRQYVGIDRNPDAVTITRRRLAAVTPPLDGLEPDKPLRADETITPPQMAAQGLF